MLLNFIKAILIGLCASIPLGPLGIMCIQKTLSKGRWSGLSIGLGAAIGDTFYSSIALFSIAFIKDFLDNNTSWVMLVGGLIIFFIGIQIAVKNPIKDVRQPKKPTGAKHIQEVLRGLLMTLSNPGAIVLMLGLVAFFHPDLGTTYKPFVVSAILAGVFLGASSWWFTLSGAVSIFRKRFRLRQILIINRVAGAVIALIGLASFSEGFVQLLFGQSIL